MGKSIYTLAQSRTERFISVVESQIISGTGTDITNKSNWKNRAKKKSITNATALALIDVVKEKGEFEREKQYWNTFYCQSKLIRHNDKMYGNYCKNRLCTTCNNNRKADLINKYYPTLKSWEDIHFVTLTVVSCDEKNLNKWINAMYRAFRLIKGRCNKRHQRGKGIKLIGVKSLECNFNATRRTYNPHFHILVPNRETAELLKEEWLRQWKSKSRLFTSLKAQDIRPVKDLEKDLVEVIKYGSKIFTEPDPNKKKKRKKGDVSQLYIYARALDNILQAFSGHRLFERFGFNLPKVESNISPSRLITDYETFVFYPKENDWTNEENFQSLSGYTIPLDLKYLLTECINKSLS